MGIEFRIIPTSLLDQANLTKLSAGAERLYWRMLLACDDYGCLRGEVIALHGRCLNGVTITTRQVEQQITELLLNKIITVWNDEQDRQWVQINDFDELQTKNMLKRRAKRTSPVAPESEEVLKKYFQKEEIKEAETNEQRILNKKILEVYQCWKEGEIATGGKGRGKLTQERRAHIKARLENGYTVEELISVINNAQNDPFYLGKNDRNKRYTDIRNIMSNDGKVDRLLQSCVLKKSETASDRLAAYE